MIDHTQFTEAYHKYSRWLNWLAGKLYRQDADGLVSDTWTRVWSHRERIQTIRYGLLNRIILGLAKSRYRNDAVEHRRIEMYSRTCCQVTEETEVPEIRLIEMPLRDRELWGRLVKYANKRGSKLKDTKIPRTTLHDFRQRIRKEYLVEEIF